MSKIRTERVAANVDGDFVVFLIGMRINKLWKVHKWLPVFGSMPKMLEELEQDPDSGLLGYETKLGIRNHVLIQYWESFEQLRDYAFDNEKVHFPGWVDYNRKIGDSGDVGIWHETYLVDADQYEAVYNNMPPYGLGRATDTVPASGRRNTAAGRLGLTDGDDAPVDGKGKIDADINPIEE